MSSSYRSNRLGSSHRHPNYNISEFCEQLDNTLERINKLKMPCIIAGDINIDFAKYNTHQDTTNYVHSLLLNNFMPMIVMPTRINLNLQQL